MTYSDKDFRIQVDNDYAKGVGRAIYNFTYLEWVIIWMIVKLRNGSWENVPKGKPAGDIARAFIKAIDNPAISVSKDLRKKLVELHENYLRAIKFRNKLLHAHPYTDQDGIQQLGSPDLKWPIERVLEAAKEFENSAIKGNDVFHKYLNK